MSALTRERQFTAVIVVMVCASLGAESELDSTQLNGLELDHSVTQMHSTTGMSQAFKEGPLEGAITKLSLKYMMQIREKQAKCPAADLECPQKASSAIKTQDAAHRAAVNASQVKFQKQIQELRTTHASANAVKAAKAAQQLDAAQTELAITQQNLTAALKASAVEKQKHEEQLAKMQQDSKNYTKTCVISEGIKHPSLWDGTCNSSGSSSKRNDPKATDPKATKSASEAAKKAAAIEIVLAQKAFKYWRNSGRSMRANCVSTFSGSTLALLKKSDGRNNRKVWAEISNDLCLTKMDDTVSARFNNSNFEDSKRSSYFKMKKKTDLWKGTLDLNRWEKKQNKVHAPPDYPFGTCDMTLCFPLLKIQGQTLKHPKMPRDMFSRSVTTFAGISLGSPEEKSACGPIRGRGKWGKFRWRAITGASVPLKILKLTRCQKVPGQVDQKCKVAKQCTFDKSQKVQLSCYKAGAGRSVKAGSISFKTAEALPNLMLELEQALAHKCMSA